MAARESTRIFSQYVEKWDAQVPNQAQLDQDCQLAIGSLQAALSPVEVNSYKKQSKEIVRMYFRDHFGQEAYKVDIWQRIKDITGKGRVSDNDMPLIDGLTPEHIPINWTNLTEEERKQELKKLFPSLFEVSLLQLQQYMPVQQTPQLVLLI